MFIPLTVAKQAVSQANHSVRNFTVYTRIHGISHGDFCGPASLEAIPLSWVLLSLWFDHHGKYRFNKSPHMQMCAGRQGLHLFHRASTHTRRRHGANRQRTGLWGPTRTGGWHQPEQGRWAGEGWGRHKHKRRERERDEETTQNGNWPGQALSGTGESVIRQMMGVMKTSNFYPLPRIQHHPHMSTDSSEAAHCVHGTPKC